MEKLLAEIKESQAVLDKELTKFIGGNKSAAARARKAAQEIAVTCKALRLAISEAKNA